MNDKKLGISNFLFTIQKQPPEVFCKKGVLKTFAKFYKKTCVKVFSFTKLQA